MVSLILQEQLQLEIGECLSRDTNSQVIDQFVEESKDIKRYLLSE